MEALFSQILRMSISASWLIIVVLIVRALLKKAPKGFRYVLWGLVAVRLLCPVFIESDFSLAPKQNVSVEIGEDNEADNDVDNEANQEAENPLVPEENQTSNVGQDMIVQDNSTISSFNRMSGMEWIWMVGVLVLFIYAVVSYHWLRGMVKVSIQKEDNIWLCDEIQSPFILGLRHPQIYLPSYIEEEHIPYIVAHEKEHIRYKDHCWKPFGFALLAIHWFNPFVWVAYVLMCKDIELACDERVIRVMNVDDKKNYSKSLLLCSNPKHFISACPVAFGEVGVKERIKKIVDYRKPSSWMIGIGGVICLIMVIGFLTNPKTDYEEATKIHLRSSMYPYGVDITDTETIKQITDDINGIMFVPFRLNLPSGGWSYDITWYDENGNEIDSMLLIGNYQIEEKYFYYLTLNKTFNTEYYDELLVANEFKRLEEEEDATVNLISKEQLEWFATEFFNNEKKHITNQFLTDVYTSPQDINLYELFYNGAGETLLGGSDIPSEEEKDMLLEYFMDEIYTDVIRVTRKDMDAVLQKYMGISLEETNKIGLDKMYYLEEYDTYYMMHGDTNYAQYIFEAGKINPDGSITLQYYRRHGTDALYWVTLAEEDGEYHIISNIMITSQRR